MNNPCKKSSSSAAWSSLSDKPPYLPRSYLLASTYPRVASNSSTSFYSFDTSLSAFAFSVYLYASDFKYASCFSSLSYLAIRLSTSEVGDFGASGSSLAGAGSGAGGGGAGVEAPSS